MRAIATVLIFVATGISAVSAQTPAPTRTASAPQGSWDTDHGHAADAAAAARAAARAARAREAAIAAGVPLAPSQNTSFVVNGDSVIRAVPKLTPEEEKADEAARAAWQARCRPTFVEDREGIRRALYAEPDCDLSRYNTAGM